MSSCINMYGHVVASLSVLLLNIFFQGNCVSMLWHTIAVYFEWSMYIFSSRSSNGFWYFRHVHGQRWSIRMPPYGSYIRHIATFIACIQSESMWKTRILLFIESQEPAHEMRIFLQQRQQSWIYRIWQVVCCLYKETIHIIHFPDGEQRSFGFFRIEILPSSRWIV